MSPSLPGCRSFCGAVSPRRGLQLAERGKLKQPDIFERQVRRMLADERSKTLVTNFASQWLFLRNVRLAKPDSFHFPDWDDGLRAALLHETELFLELSGPGGPQYRRVAVGRLYVPQRAARQALRDRQRLRQPFPPRRVFEDEHHRGGLLGHGSILLVTSYANRTSPVIRGKWLLENFLNYTPPAPPPDVPDLPPLGKGEQARSMRERVEQHRQNPVLCGLPQRHGSARLCSRELRRHRAVSGRPQMDCPPIDASGVMPDGTAFEGFAGLRRVMENRRDDFVSTVAEKLLMYALGRGLEYYDQPVVQQDRA